MNNVLVVAALDPSPAEKIIYVRVGNSENVQRE
jgi:hypothetical protein